MPETVIRTESYLEGYRLTTTAGRFHPNDRIEKIIRKEESRYWQDLYGAFTLTADPSH